MTDDALAPGRLETPLEKLERTLRWMGRIDRAVRRSLALLALVGAYLAGYVLHARGWIDSAITVFYFFVALFCLYEPYFVGGVIDRCVRDTRAGTPIDPRARKNWLLRLAFKSGKHGILNVSLLSAGAAFAAAMAARYFLARRTGEAVANVLIVLANAGVAATVLLCRRFYLFYAPLAAKAGNVAHADGRR